MIDLADLRKRPDAYQDAAKKKRIAFDVKNFLALDERRRERIAVVEKLRAEKNKISKEIAQMDKGEREIAVKEMKKSSDDLKEKEEELALLEDEWNLMLLAIPSIPLPHVPVGKDDTENREVKKWGTPPTFDFEIKDHVTLGQDLDIIDIPRG